MNSKINLIVKCLIKEIKNTPSLYKSFNFSYKTQKYKLSQILTDILYVLKTGIAWRDIKSDSHWNTLYKAFIKLNKNNILKISYTNLLHKYICKSPSKKLKFISTDTHTVYNKYGYNMINRNKYYKNKKVMKLSIDVDSNGIPIKINVYPGNMHDSKIYMSDLNKEYLIDENLLNKHKVYLLADTGYDSKRIRDKLQAYNFIPIIPINKRNKKGEIKKLSNKYKKIYKKRIIVENNFCKISKLKRLTIRYDKDYKNYLGFVYLGYISILIK